MHLFSKFYGCTAHLIGKWIGKTFNCFRNNYWRYVLKEDYIYKQAIFLNSFKRFKIFQKINKKNKNLNLKNEFVFIIYRNIPGVPFFISNILPTIFDVKVKNYFFGTLMGLTPNLFIGASLGSGIEKIIEKK